MYKLITAVLLGFGTSGAAQEGGPGEAFFLEGLGGTAILANGAVEIPAVHFPCASCHGDDARGNREGSTIFPPLLISQNGVDSVSMTLDELAAALLDGVSFDGQTMSSAMPRYRAPPETIASLHNYLNELARAGRVGISADRIFLAPPEDADVSNAFAYALHSANLSGGAWSRQFEISTLQVPMASADEALAILQDRIDQSITQAVAAELVRHGITQVATDLRKERFEALLAQRGINLGPTPRAYFRTENGTTTIVIDGAEFTVFENAMLAPEVSEIPDQEVDGYIAGREIAQAVLACGRAVTRRCVLERLKVADITE